MVHLLAFSLQDQVEKYGAYIGIAAFFGLAVLSILYFAQARELRRLRDWAGRAPERAQEVEARAIAQAEAARRVQAQPRTTPAPATAGAVAAAAGAAGTAGAVTQVVGPEETQQEQEGQPAAANGTTAAASEAGEAEPPAEEAEGAKANGDTPPAEAMEGEAKPEAEATSEEDDDEGTPEEADKQQDGDGAAKPAAVAAAGAVGAVAAAKASSSKSADGDPAPEGEQKPAEEAEKPGEEAEKPGEEAEKPSEEAAQPAAEHEPAAEEGAKQDEPKADDDDEDSREIPVAPIPRATPLPRRAPAPAAPLRQPNRSATVPPRRPVPAGRAGSAPRASSGGSGRSGWLVPALVGAGGLVVLVIALFAFGVIGGSDATTPPPNTASTATPDGTSQPSENALTPAATKVAVLNGTTIPGLASREKDTLTDAGFNEIATGNNTDQQRGESAVLYGTRSGARSQARTVAQRLDIANVERLDADTRDLSEDADVVVILGQDKAP